MKNYSDNHPAVKARLYREGFTVRKAGLPGYFFVIDRYTQQPINGPDGSTWAEVFEMSTNAFDLRNKGKVAS